MRTIIFFLISFSLLSCTQKEKSKLFGQKILFSDSLLLMKNGNITKFDIKNYENTYKIIVSLSGDCPKCLRPIDTIQQLFKKLENDLKVIPFFVMDISDTSYFHKFIYPLLPQNVNYVLNLDYVFQKQNSLLVPEIRYHGIVLDEKNIIIYDSFVLTDKNMVDYFYEINELINNKSN